MPPDNIHSCDLICAASCDRATNKTGKRKTWKKLVRQKMRKLFKSGPVPPDNRSDMICGTTCTFPLRSSACHCERAGYFSLRSDQTFWILRPFQFQSNILSSCKRNFSSANWFLDWVTDLPTNDKIINLSDHAYWPYPATSNSLKMTQTLSQIENSGKI